jgi:hypothetical protein
MSESPPPPASCLACRATGTATFVGVAGWLAHERRQLPPSARTHRLTLAAMSTAFLGAAAARWFL